MDTHSFDEYFDLPGPHEQQSTEEPTLGAVIETVLLPPMDFHTADALQKTLQELPQQPPQQPPQERQQATPQEPPQEPPQQLLQQLPQELPVTLPAPVTIAEILHFIPPHFLMHSETTSDSEPKKPVSLLSHTPLQTQEASTNEKSVGTISLADLAQIDPPPTTDTNIDTNTGVDTDIGTYINTMTDINTDTTTTTTNSTTNSITTGIDPTTGIDMDEGPIVTRLRRRRSTAQEKAEEKHVAVVGSKKKRAKKLYCICQQPYNGDPMVQCGQCEEWYHCECVHLDPEEAEDLDWLCKKCEDANTAKVQKNPVSLPAPVVIALPPQPTTPPPPPPPPPTPPVLITLPASTVHNLQRKPIEKTYSGRNARYSAIQAKCIYPPCLNRTRVDSYCSDICVRLDAVRQATREPKDSDYAPPADDTRAHRRIRHVSGPLTELEKPKPLPSPGHQKMPSISLSISSSGPNSPILDIQSPGLGTEENPIRKNVIKNMTVILKSIMESALENDPTLFDIESDQETIDTKPNSPTEETTEDKSVPVEISEHEVSLPVADSTTTKPEKDTDMSANTDINIDADTEMTVAVTVNHSSLLEVDSATDMETDKDAGITAIATDMKTDNSTKLVTDKTEETATAMTIETTRSNSDDYTTAIKTDINSTPTSTPITTPTTVTDPQDIQKKQRPVQEMAAELAQSIEEVMYLQLGDPHPFPNRPLICGERYKGKFRSLLYNLKDKANEVFQIRVVTGELTPDELIKMSSEAMANPELKSMSETLRKKSIKNSVLKVQSMPFIKKTHKGDIIMIPKGENEYSDESVKAKAFARDMTMAYENNKESSEGNESLGNSLEISKNSAHPSPPLTTANITANTIPLSDSLTHSTLHMTTASATSSPTNTLHANALTTTALPPRHDPLDDILARIGVSTEDMHEDSNKRPSISLTTPHRAKKRKSTFDVEKMLGDEDIQLEIGSDDEGFITTRRTQDGDTVRVQLTEDKEEVPVEESTPKLPGIWKGRVNMPQVAEFEAMARQVGGRPLTPVEWAEVLSPTMWIEGRIPQERVTNYVSQTQYSSSREIILLEIEAATLLPEAAKEARASNTKQSDTLLKYFNSRQRYGVVGHNKTKVKDFYLIPLYKAHDIPDCLYVVRIEESKRDCDLFLGVLILTKQSEQQQQQQRPYSIPPAYQHHPPYEP